MKNLKSFLFSLVAVHTVFTCSLSAHEIVVKDSHGENFVLNVHSEDSFGSVMDQIQTLLELPENEQKQFLNENQSLSAENIEKEQSPCCLNFASSGIDMFKVSARAIQRDYNAIVTPQEKKDIAFIVNTLAKSSLVSLLKQKSTLEKTGDRINHVHPLKFLITVFSNEELKVNIRNIKPRGWVWGDFVKGLKDSLSEESGRGNMANDIVHDFAHILEIPASAVLPAIREQKWDDLIDILITIIPRKGNHGRYDM